MIYKSELTGKEYKSEKECLEADLKAAEAKDSLAIAEQKREELAEKLLTIRDEVDKEIQKMVETRIMPAIKEFKKADEEVERLRKENAKSAHAEWKHGRLDDIKDSGEFLEALLCDLFGG